MRFQIHQDRAIATPLCPGKIVNANHLWNTLRTARVADEAAQQGGATGRKLHLCCQTHTRLATSNGCHTTQQLGRRVSPALVASSKRREIFAKRPTRTSWVGTAKAMRLNQQNDSAARTGEAANVASKPAMSCQCVGLTRRTPVTFTCRNEAEPPTHFVLSWPRKADE